MLSWNSGVSSAAGKSVLTNSMMGGCPALKGEVLRWARMVVRGEEVELFVASVKDWNAGEACRSAGESTVGHSEVIWMVEGSWILVPITKRVLLFDDWRA